MSGLLGVSAHSDEIRRALPGDELVPDAQVVMDRGFELPASPREIWPWFAQLGKNRAGWYLPRRLESVLPVGRRALRHVEPSLQHLAPGDVIDDWGGRDATFEIVALDPPSTLVHRSQRGNLEISWVISVRALDEADRSRVHLRFRIAGVRQVWLVRTVGELLDLLTVAGLAAGLRERVAP